MNLLCDLFALALVVICAVFGWFKGFVKTFFSLFGTLLGLIGAAVLSPIFASFLKETFFLPAISRSVLTILTEKTGQSASEINLLELPEEANAIVARFSGAVNIKEWAVAEGASSGEGVLTKFARTVADPLASAASYVVAFLVLFLVLFVLLRVLCHVLDLIAKIPVLRFSNRSLGLVCGVIKGVLLAFVFALVLDQLSGALRGSENDFIASYDTAKTYLIRFLVQFHPMNFWK